MPPAPRVTLVSCDTLAISGSEANTVNGVPDWAWKKPESDQPLRNGLVEPEVGMSQTKLVLNRCVRSKSDTARLFSRLRESPCAMNPVFGTSGFPPPAVLPGSLDITSIDFEKVYAMLNCRPRDSRFVRLNWPPW